MIRSLRSGYILIIGLVAGGIVYWFSGTFHWAYLATVGAIFGLYFFADDASP